MDYVQNIYITRSIFFYIIVLAIYMCVFKCENVVEFITVLTIFFFVNVWWAGIDFEFYGLSMKFSNMGVV